jgi:hypothetical protein
MLVVAATCIFVEPTSGIIVGILLSLGTGALQESKARCSTPAFTPALRLRFRLLCFAPAARVQGPQLYTRGFTPSLNLLCGIVGVLLGFGASAREEFKAR